MQLIKRIFDFYIDSSIHVALAVCSLIWITLVNFHVGVELDFIYFMFFASVTGYNFVKYFGLAKFHHRSLSSWLKYIQVFSFLCFIGLVYFSFKLDIKTLLYLGGLGIITFLYAIPFLPRNIFLDSSKNLRAISGLKVYVIALVWALATVIIPLINSNYGIDHDVIITTIQRYLYVLIVMLPFEIRDMRYDNLKLSTIPQRIGVRRTKIIGSLLIIIFFFLEYFKDEFWQKQAMILTIVALLMFLTLILSRANQNKYFSAFWVESIPILWAVISIANY